MSRHQMEKESCSRPFWFRSKPVWRYIPLLFRGHSNNALNARGFFSEEISRADLWGQIRVFKNKVLSLSQLPLTAIPHKHLPFTDRNIWCHPSVHVLEHKFQHYLVFFWHRLVVFPPPIEVLFYTKFEFEHHFDRTRCQHPILDYHHNEPPKFNPISKSVIL